MMLTVNDMAANPDMTGLSADEAQTRLEAEGANELPRQRARSLLHIAFEVLREPMFAMLLAAGGIYFILGDVIEASLLFVFASVSVLITIIQESRSERVLEALRELTSPRALVVRDGERRRIPGREVVRGDLLVLAEGDRVAADASLVSCDDLLVDESLLTGESVPVRKRASEWPGERAISPGGDDLPEVFAGTMAVRGQGLARVNATGGQTRIGQIGRSLATIESASPRLKQETRAIVRTFAFIGLLCCVAAVLLFGLLRGSWLDAALVGIALGMSMLPEEFPLVLTVFMVMGAWRLSRARVLVRRAPAIETLGAATILCTDKTGTLTENRMTVVELRTLDETARVSPLDWSAATGALRKLVDRAVLASAPDPFDAMEKALYVLHARSGGTTARDLRLAKVYPMRPTLLAVAQAWSEPGGERHVISIKGAPETIVGLCRLPADAAAVVIGQADEMAAAGLRVLGIAEAVFQDAKLPESQREFDFQYLGLIGLEDPLRAGVPEAVRECRSAGIRIIMMTGDYPKTARAIAHQAGLDTEVILSGSEVEALSDDELRAVAARTSIFARIMPEQKLRLVRALKARGEVVAMTGDGVNDAPALRAADIGIAMGGRGSDVAREASSIVLLDDDFGSIVTTIRLGRRIYDNLRKAMTYILAVHIPIAGMALLPLITGYPIVFWPLHIAFLEMVIDPVCSLVFEAEREESDVMRRRPRSPDSRLLAGSVIVWGLLQGATAFVVVGAIYLFDVLAGQPEADVRELTFITIVLVNLALVFNNRSYATNWIRAFARPNKALLWIAGVAIAVIAAAVFWSPARILFGFGAFDGRELAIAVTAAAFTLAVLELAKRHIRWGLTA